MWDKRVLEKIEVMVGIYSVSVKWQGVGDGFIWACSGVYGPNENVERDHMWDELVGIQQYWKLPWCYFGDFNIVRYPSERRGEARLTLAMEKFSEFIKDLNLVDLPLDGGRYTWSSGTDQPAMSRCSSKDFTTSYLRSQSNSFGSRGDGKGEKSVQI